MNYFVSITFKYGLIPALCYTIYGDASDLGYMYMGLWLLLYELLSACGQI